MQYICHILKAHNIEFVSNIGGYGVVAMISGDRLSDKVIGLRADMDALPI